MVAKLFPRKQVCKKKNLDKFFGRKYFMVLKSFPQDEERKKCLAENFFMFAKSFPRKQVCMKRGR